MKKKHNEKEDGIFDFGFNMRPEILEKIIKDGPIKYSNGMEFNLETPLDGDEKKLMLILIEKFFEKNERLPLDYAIASELMQNEDTQVAAFEIIGERMSKMSDSERENEFDKMMKIISRM